jgi:hypothetical protein
MDQQSIALVASLLGRKEGSLVVADLQQLSSLTVLETAWLAYMVQQWRLVHASPHQFRLRPSQAVFHWWCTSRLYLY